MNKRQFIKYVNERYDSELTKSKSISKPKNKEKMVESVKAFALIIDSKICNGDYDFLEIALSKKTLVDDKSKWLYLKGSKIIEVLITPIKKVGKNKGKNK